MNAYASMTAVEHEKAASEWAQIAEALRSTTGEDWWRVSVAICAQESRGVAIRVCQDEAAKHGQSALELRKYSEVTDMGF